MSHVDLTDTNLTEDEVKTVVSHPTKETSAEVLQGIRVMGMDGAIQQNAHGGGEIIIGNISLRHIKETLQREWKLAQGDMSVVDKIVRVIEQLKPIPSVIEFQIISGQSPAVPKLSVIPPHYIQQGTTVNSDILKVPEMKNDGLSMAITSLSKIEKSILKIDELCKDWCLDPVVVKKSIDTRSQLDKKCLISLLTSSVVQGVFKRLNTIIAPVEQQQQPGTRKPPAPKMTTKSLLFIQSVYGATKQGCKNDDFIVKATELHFRTAITSQYHSRAMDVFKLEGVTYPKQLGNSLPQLSSSWTSIFSLETEESDKPTEEGQQPETRIVPRYKTTADLVKAIKSNSHKDALKIDAGENPAKERRQPPIPFISLRGTEFSVSDIVETDTKRLSLLRDKLLFTSSAPHLGPYLPDKKLLPPLVFLSSISKSVLPQHTFITDVVIDVTTICSHIVSNYSLIKELSKGGFDFIWQKADFGKYRILASKSKPEPNKRFSLPRSGNSPTNSTSLGGVDPKLVLSAAGVPQGSYQVGKKGTIFLKEEAVDTLESKVHGKRCDMVKLIQKFIHTRKSIIHRVGLQVSPIQRCIRCHFARKRAHQKRVDFVIAQHIAADNTQRESDHQNIITAEDDLFAEIISKFKSPLPLLFRRTVIFAQKQELESRLCIFDEELNEVVRMSNTFEEQKSVLKKVQRARWKARDSSYRDLYSSFIDHESGCRTRLSFDEDALRRKITKTFLKPIKKEYKLRKQLHREAELLLLTRGQEQSLSPSSFFTSAAYNSDVSQTVGYSRMNVPYSTTRESPASPPRFY